METAKRLLWQKSEKVFDICETDRQYDSLLCFGVFYINPYDSEIVEKIHNILAELKSSFAEWNNDFPWSEGKGVEFTVTSTSIGTSIPYILAYLDVKDDIKLEEGLILAILQKISGSLDPNTFIKVADSDGDFVMMEVIDLLPSEYEFPKGNNRLWLNMGKFKLIPVEYDLGRSTMAEANCLSFLSQYSFKLHYHDEINSHIMSTWVEGFPSRYLDKLVKLPININPADKNAEILMKNPQMLSYLIKSLIKINKPLPIMEIAAIDQSIHMEPLVLLEHCQLLELRIDSEMEKSYDTESKPDLYGFWLMWVINELCQNDDKLKQPAIQNKVELDTESLIAKYAFKTFDFKPSDDISSVEPTDSLIKIMTAAFAQLNKIPDRYADDYEEEEDESGRPHEQSSSDKRKQDASNIDDIVITEDDFFEFFMKEALKLKDEELENYRGEG